MRLLARSAIILVAITFPVLAASMPGLEDPREVAGLTGPDMGPVLVRYAALAEPEPLTADGGPVATPKPSPTLAPQATAPAATAAPTQAPARTTPPPATPAPATAAPAPRPAATARPTPAPTPFRYDREDVKRRIRASWPGDKDKAIAVVDCETGGTFNPRMTSANGMYLGLWQFHRDTWERNGGTGDPRDHSPEEQTRIAWNLYQKKGWEPWPTCGAN